MKTITLTVDVDGNAISREYAFDEATDSSDWGARVQDILDTIKKSEDIVF